MFIGIALIAFCLILLSAYIGEKLFHDKFPNIGVVIEIAAAAAGIIGVILWVASVK